MVSRPRSDPHGFPPATLVEPLLRLALAEDLPGGVDITSAAMFEADAVSEGIFQAKADGLVAGLPLIPLVFGLLDSAVSVELLVDEGAAVKPKDAIARVRGPVRALLSGERTTLNLVMRLSGIATATAAYVRAVEGTKARIVDTRKTTPGLRVLEKYAVRVGGGHNHRMSLSDAAMIKDNHLAASGDPATAIRGLRRRLPHTARLEVEVTDLATARIAAQSGADIVLLDNMSVDDMAAVVKELTGRVVLEASGGINLDTVAPVAKTGVDVISVGALTHSVRALDISFELAGVPAARCG